MNRRDFMRDAAAGLSVSQFPNFVTADEAPEDSPRSWPKNLPFVAVGSWDDMPIFVRRVGGQATWEESDYRREHTEETVQKLKNLGVTIAITDFYKGFGLEAENDHINLARKLVGLLRQQGIRVGLYVGSTIAYETFLLEEPGAEEWFVPDYLGRPVIYDDQPFRKRVYFMLPRYVEYIKRVVQVGAEDLKADLIHFDNTSLQGRPEIFQHPLAIKDFREYLQRAYSAAELKQRLGFSSVKYVQPPVVDRHLTVIDDPLFRLWTDFRTYTAGTGYYGAESTRTVAMAESMIFNRQSLGKVGGILEAANLPDDQNRYIKFFHTNFEYYRDVQNIPDVAVLYSYASMGFNNYGPAVSFMLFTQSLIQANLPFDIIFDEQVRDLSKYRVLVLADQECLNDEQTDLIRKCVEHGGGLVATEQSSLYTNRRLRRPDFGLKDLFKVSAPPWRGSKSPEMDLQFAPVWNRIAHGRATYIATVKPAIEKQTDVPMSSKYWKLPLNWKELMDGVKWVVAGRLSLEFNVPGSLAVVSELIEQQRRTGD